MSTKVLVFESDAAFASELRNELGKLGCNTHVVDDGNVGLQQAAADRPDLILLSIELPRMNGFSVCNKLKKDPALKDVPLIIMSSESSDETFEQHRKLRTRAEDYVHKPIAFGELLQHIQSFVRLGGSHAPSEGAIVIEDEISLNAVEMEDEGTQIGKRPDFPMSVRPSKSDVDSEVDAFTDAAFGMLTGTSNVPPPPQEVVNGARAGSASPPAQRFPSTPPRASSSPSYAVDNAELDRVRGDLERAQAELERARGDFDRAQGDLETANARAADLDRDVAAAKEQAARLQEAADRGARALEESERMQRDIDELKTKLASAPKAATGGVSSREFLDLREALNKKDKEILNLREQLGKKDKEILDTQEKTIALERLKGELDDKNLAADRELADAREKIENLSADKDQAKKAAEDFKTRLGRVQSDLEARAREIADLKSKQQDEAAAHEAAIASLRGDMQQAIDHERADKNLALERAEAQRASDAEQAKKALDDAKEYAARERSDALLARERELRQETDTKLAALHRAHQEELNRTKAEFGRQIDATNAKHAAELGVAEQRRQDNVAALEREAAERLASREEELEARRIAEVATLSSERDERIQALERDHATTLAALNHEHSEKVSTLEADRDERLLRLKRESEERASALENDRDARVAAIEARLAREVAEVRAVAEAEKAAAGEQLATADREIRDLKEQLASAIAAKSASDAANAARISELEQKLAEMTTHRDQLQGELESTQRSLGEARDRIGALEGEGARLRGDLDDTRGKLSVETSRANKAFAKWESDKSSLDRAKDALAVALQQIEEAEQRAIGE
jgi:DNA-binding response OmpR family regulator/chromosome segregation ATPase